MTRPGMLIFRLCVLASIFGFAYSSARGFAQTPTSPESRPLPELNAFLDRIKDNLKSDRLLLCQYTYTMKSSTRYLDKKGRVKKIQNREYEVYPSLDEDRAYERLISKDGRPLDAGKLEEQDRKYKKKADARERKLAGEQKSDQEDRLAKEAEESRKERETIEDLLQLYEFTLLRREMIDSHSAIWIEFTPKSQYRPQTKDGNMLKKLRGRALVSDSDYQIIRVDVELSEDLSFGLGLLARLHKGATLRFMRRKINNEIWLPAEFELIGSARVFLLKQLRVESTSFFSEYKKYSVSSTFEWMTGKPSQ